MTLDIYHPPKFDFRENISAVLFVPGYTDKAEKKLVGGNFKDYIQPASWCRIIAASGLAAIAYQSDNPEEDIFALLSFFDSNDVKLRIDHNNLAAFSLSAHTPKMISNIMGFMTPGLPDPKSWRKDIPIMVIRAGNEDVFFINHSFLGFYKKAINQNDVRILAISLEKIAAPNKSLNRTPISGEGMGNYCADAG